MIDYQSVLQEWLVFSKQIYEPKTETEYNELLEFSYQLFGEYSIEQPPMQGLFLLTKMYLQAWEVKTKPSGVYELGELQHTVIKSWIYELSNYLKRSTDSLLTQGLASTDFPSSSQIELEFPDASKVVFQSAFFLENTSRELIAVFTEHCGYHVFPIQDLQIRKISTHKFRI
jgi:hypothetical protein